eukprot:TRINITY_DN3341_c0_g2_i9.p1 TRINITY_DN3341_c0_g2~~TRINITY_DN3341_c0_g2_i9.p1  ORF type:complete len:227 (-),score=41.99 TRINITY_DN3341_c0_g2_i9:33-713(-)
MPQIGVCAHDASKSIHICCNSQRKYFVSLSKYSLFDWLKLQCLNYSKRNISLLDLGCGPGLVGTCLRENGIIGTITGIDISPGMLKYALETKNYTGGVFVHDLDLPLPTTIGEGKYDLVTCFAVSEMLSDIKILFTGINKALKQDGEAWLSVQWNKDGNNPLQHQGMKHYTQEQVLGLLLECGLFMKECTEQPQAYCMPTKDHSWMDIPYLLIKCHKFRASCEVGE